MLPTSHFFIVLTIVTLLANAFPLFPQKPAIRRRVAYSVVAVDGGSAATSTPQDAATTVMRTVDHVATVTAPTVTLVVSTETVISTEPAKTVEISVTQDLTETVTISSSSVSSLSSKPAYTVVNAGDIPSSATIVVLTAQTSIPSTTETSVPPTSSPTSTFTALLTSTSISTAISTSAPSAYSSSSASYIAPGSNGIVPVSSPTANSPAIDAILPSQSTAVSGGGFMPAGLPLPMQPAPLSTSGPTSPIARPTATSKTYDDGMWHTTYPSWNSTSTAIGSSSTGGIIHKPYNIWRRG